MWGKIPLYFFFVCFFHTPPRHAQNFSAGRETQPRERNGRSERLSCCIHCPDQKASNLNTGGTLEQSVAVALSVGDGFAVDTLCHDV